MKETRYYARFTDDFVKSPQQGLRLPENYVYVRTGWLSRLWAAVVYALALLVSFFYCRLGLRMHIRGRKNLRRAGKGGLFLYGNHTQPVGDVFTPAHCLFPRRIYTLASPANYGLLVIGRLLPYLGALPVADTVHGMRALQQAMDTRLRQGCGIVVYPEAHVWEYYTGIRPFPVTSFKFPVRFEVPVYAMTVTYQAARWGKRPRMVVYIDGPFAPTGDTAAQKAESLRAAVRTAMEERSRMSTVEYIRYKPKNVSTVPQDGGAE